VDSSITFHCKSGHEFCLVELLRAQSAAFQGGLELLLAAWNREHHTLINTVEDARRNGFLDVAEIFNRHAKSLESRIEKVRSACSQSGSNKRILRPDAIRTA
jgi:hypothetical protein